MKFYLVILLAVVTIVHGNNNDMDDSFYRDYMERKMNKRYKDDIEYPPTRTMADIEHPSMRTRDHIEWPPRRPTDDIEWPPSRSADDIEWPPRRPPDDIEWPPRRSMDDIEWPPRRSTDNIEYPPRRTRFRPQIDIYPTCTRPGKWCQWDNPESDIVLDYLRDKVNRALDSGGKHQKVIGFMFAYRKKSGRGFKYALTYKQPPFKGILFTCVIAFYEDTRGKEHIYPESFFCGEGYRKTNNRLIEWVLEGIPIPGDYTIAGV